MWLSSGGVVLALSPFVLGWFTFVAASPEPPLSHRSDLGWTHGKRCVKPQVRREWRALSVQERAEWISAVKVGHSIEGNLTPSLEVPPTI